MLQNVELALTLSGVSKAERRRRAAEALEKVGLGDQLHKRPGFVLFPSILYDGVQKKLTFQIIQRVQVQQVIAASVLCAVEVGSLVMDIARDLHMGAVHGQQGVPVPTLFGTVPERKTAQNVFKD